MAEGRNRAAWSRTAALLAMLHNINCTKRGDMKTAADFDPFRVRRAAPPRVDISVLKTVFVGNRR